MFADPTFWVFVALLAFVGAVAMAKAPAAIAAKLDARAEQIRITLAEAAQLKADAEALLAQYTARQAEAEQQAQEILAAAQAEAQRLREDAQSHMNKTLRTRTQMAERKIAQAETQAIADVRAAAAELAANTATRIFESQLAGKDADRLVDEAIAETRGKFASA